MKNYLSTEPYKGTRDFYPEDMAILEYIFDKWSTTALSFGYQRYDASILEPSELYRSKASENEEIINEQTYSFTDRGDREVTLRPEMTPTVARMVAGKRRDISFPARWFSIPNVFRYERPQKGRLREHWQLNCDIFGTHAVASDVEMIALAHAILTSCGASPEFFEIRVNDRAWLNEQFDAQDIAEEKRNPLLALIDRKEKITNFEEEAEKILGKKFTTPVEILPGSRLDTVVTGLHALGITNVRYSPSTVRGFNYYTGVVFEIFDTSPANNRSLIGGGRYDNLTQLFGGDAIPGFGFGMGDVTMRDFLETYNLIPAHIKNTGPQLVVIPTDNAYAMHSEVIAHSIRLSGISTAVDLSDKKIGKKISTALEEHAKFIIVVGEDEVSKNIYTLKELATKVETPGSLESLIAVLKRP